ncbi:MAG TPA: protein-L-isoaspartate O-methyltransferase [Devosiaceae bacterium]|nr:protein-L-isoaspartate O-methyltransferase [Devosiaceae bacterium]
MIDFVAARKKMVENQLRTTSITDRRLLSVMAQVPREIFVPEARRELAYIDEAHVLPASGEPRYLPAPAPFGRLVQLARINTDDAVLDLGCGTGYSTAVLAELAVRVVAVESDVALAEEARRNLASLGLDNAQIVQGPIEAGAPSEGPFDVIILDGAVEVVPEGLFGQLAEGGRLVALVRQGAAAVAHLFVRSGADVAGKAEFNTTLPPLPAGKAPREFVF